MVCARPSSSASEELSSAPIGLQYFFVKPHVTLDHLAHIELGMRLAPGRLAHLAAPAGVGQQCGNGVCQRGAVARRYDYARVLVQLLAYAADIGSDHGRAAAH